MFEWMKFGDQLENRGEVVNGEVLALYNMIGLDGDGQEAVTVEKALGVPALWAAVNFLSATLAGLPIGVYRKTKEGRKPASGAIPSLLAGAVNDYTSSFKWRKQLFVDVFTQGRAYTFIEKNALGKPMNLWRLNPLHVTPKADGVKFYYEYKAPNQPKKTYQADEILDIPFLLASDDVSHHGPISTNKDIIRVAIAATKYGQKFFASGGVPPFAVTGNFQSGKAMEQAAKDMVAAIKKASKENRSALVLPSGLDIKALGVDPEKMQFVALQVFLLQQIARIYSLPPVFLQDLTNGTFSNTEQQDVHFVKHTIKGWIEQTEQEINLKLFGRSKNNIYAEFNVDGLLRGDFMTRMQGYASGVQNGIFTPNEVRELENKPTMEGGDDLLIQGATVPIKNQLILPLEGDEQDEE